MTGAGAPVPNIGDADYPGYAMGAAAHALNVTPAFLRAVETAGLFEAHRSDGGHRRYSLDDLHLAERARHLVDDGLPLDAAVRIVKLEYQLAAAQAMIEVLQRRLDQPRGSG
ncbi:MerR family transcriptional regulator [Catellatospora coxensis]|uniref:MerR family transcriptional regulator n=1 Tax=Catellatospora coxensis TaxID=310354 RepID=A0A8J3KT31_9ACTN|nr:MerR family transcriptional regulator [Catellatospora coxensis]GIG05722.1 MerR family transcriptional regulator [Catellatospora coxensis]